MEDRGHQMRPEKATKSLGEYLDGVRETTRRPEVVVWAWGRKGNLLNQLHDLAKPKSRCNGYVQTKSKISARIWFKV